MKHTRTEGSAVLAFRIFVMLSCLIIVPMAAIFGSAFPDVVKSVLVDRIVEWATGKAPPSKTGAGDDPFGTVAPAPTPTAGATPSEAPRWPAAGGDAWQVPASPPPTGGVVPAVAFGEPSTGNQQAVHVAPAEASPYRTAAASVPQAASHPGASDPRPLQPDPFTSMERKLREYGATYYLLETWGNNGELFRFHCKMAIGNNPNYTRHFEATDRDALRAMSQVLEQVESWRSGRPQ
jgi:hypothetical protein